MFVNLHTHTHYSLLDGLSSPEMYVDRAVQLGQPALAITDHGSLSGLYRLWKACKDANIKPIAGCEFYVAPESRHRKEPVRLGTEDQRDSDVSGSGSYTHLTVLARNVEGLRNLYQLQALAYSEGFYRKPRIDLDALSLHREGLICLTGCPGGMASILVRLGQTDKAKQHVSMLKDIFGEHVYIEMMSHGIDFEKTLNASLMDISTALDVPWVATSDSHYCGKEDADTHQALLCVQTRSKLDSPTFTFSGDVPYHLASYDEMLALDLVPASAVTNTMRIAEQIEPYDDVFAHALRMPKYDHSDVVGHLRFNATERLRDLVGAEDDRLYKNRLEYELDTIGSLGFAPYFLIVADIINEAKHRGIRIGPARGSAGGSLVAYALGITDLDPLPSGLLFERFLNPERVGLPDIDIDIQEDRRDDVLEIAREKYGNACVASLGTFGTIGAKAALKDSARVLGHSYKVGEERTWQLPKPKFGFQPNLSQYTGPKDDVYKLAVGLEGTVRSESVHAAAIVISPDPLKELIPLRLQSGKGHWVTAFDMHEIEDLGFVKTDLLGLRTLKVIDDCLRMLEAERKTSLVLPTSPEKCTDRNTYTLLSKGDSLGIFQLDSAGMRGLLRGVRPTSFTDIAAVLSLFRPGPMGVGAERSFAERKHGRERASFPHPELAEALGPILKDTYGLIIFQEQVLEVLAAVGGYTYATAENIFNAMRKKQLDKMEAAKPDFVDRMEYRGYSQDAIDALWETLVPFASYSFNKSHATGYALIAYWTAYLKANHPHEFMAALLSNEPDRNTFNLYLEDVRRRGVFLLPPDVNESQETFTPTADGIRYGLAAIKGVGDKAVQAIRKVRASGQFTSLRDWYMRAPKAALNVSVLNALIKSGSLDSVCPNREGHVKEAETLAGKAVSHREAIRKGQRGIATIQYAPKDVPQDNERRRRWEAETLGVELSFGTLHIRPTKPLGADEWHWVKGVLAACPGLSPAVLEWGTIVLDAGYSVDPDRARDVLSVLGTMDIEVR